MAEDLVQCKIQRGTSAWRMLQLRISDDRVRRGILGGRVGGGGGGKGRRDRG